MDNALVDWSPMQLKQHVVTSFTVACTDGINLTGSSHSDFAKQHASAVH